MEQPPAGRFPSIFERLGIGQRRDLFTTMNRLMVIMWRMGLGPRMNAGPGWAGRIMVLGTRGRKSGLWRWTPLNFALAAGEVYCLAGFGSATDWYRNLQQAPEVEVWLPFGAWRGVAETVTDPEERLQRLRQVLVASGFAAPLFGGIDPRIISDAELEREVVDYHLVRIRLTEQKTDRRIADLSWVWPVVGGAALGLGLALAALLRRR